MSVSLLGIIIEIIQIEDPNNHNTVYYEENNMQIISHLRFENIIFYSSFIIIIIERR